MRNLLHRPDADTLKEVSKVLTAAAKVFSVPRGHRQDLPYAVRDLSRILTSERGEMGRSYWGNPRYLSAYIHYFLPWNLYRLSWLLPRLDFFPNANKDETIKFLDLGSGPLTLPLAIWCARPDLRSRDVHFTCSDVSSKPMELGLSILRELSGGTRWKVQTERGHIDGVLGKKSGTYHCILAGNVLNELDQGRHDTLEQRLEQLAASMQRHLLPGGKILAVEPGTRLGGKMTATLRKAALKRGFSVLAPCTHSASCPMLSQGRRGPGPSYTGWCHFISPALDVPKELSELSKKARLEKESLSLSCLLLEKNTTAEAPQTASDRWHSDDLEQLEELYQEIMQEDAEPVPTPARQRESKKSAPLVTKNETKVSGIGFARVISRHIRLPGEEEAARYVCFEGGLGLLTDAAKTPSGAAVRATWDETGKRDMKTGALFITKTEKV